ncbi:ATP-binding protein [Aquiluna sp. Uisw_065]|jgi:uridine kinase|uniref:ATP-binding protein n=1 Tax=Aquiluna sp. Uisw_065 TaxID=3230967 RepID=UPI0039EBB015
MPRNLLSYEEALVSVHSKLDVLMNTKNTAIVLIDGRAGSGKSRFTGQLADLIFRSEKQLPKLIHMDDLYPGWDGLRAGSTYLNRSILQPIAAGKQAAWQVWDWELGRRGTSNEPANGWRSFEGGNLVLAEGCGSVSKASSELADLTIWIESDAGQRKTRISARDQGQFDSYWAAWSIQEDEFYEQEQTTKLCEITVEN